MVFLIGMDIFNQAFSFLPGTNSASSCTSSYIRNDDLDTENEHSA